MRKILLGAAAVLFLLGASGCQDGDGGNVFLISANDLVVDEGDGAATIDVTVRISQLPEEGTEVTVDYSLSPGTAEDGADYEAATGTLTFRNDLSPEQTIGVSILGDEICEDDESFHLVLSNAVNAVIVDGVADVTIANDDPGVVVLRTFDTPASNKRPEGLTYDGASLYLMEVNEGRVYVIDPDDFSVETTMTYPSTHALGFDGTDLWSSTYWNDPPSFYRYTTAGTLQETLTLDTLCAHPTAIAYDTSEDVVWAVNTNHATNPVKFWKIDPDDGTALGSYDLDPSTPSAYGMCMDVDADYAWLAAGVNNLYKVSLADLEVVASYTVPGGSLLMGIACIGEGIFWVVSGNTDEILEIKVFE